MDSIETFFFDSVNRFTSYLVKLDTCLPPDAPPVASEHLSELTGQINDCLAACQKLERELGNRPELKAVQKRFREAIWPWFGKSWFMQRALEKPCGYPGDYELLTAIYNGQPKSLGLGGWLDLYFLNTTLAKAVVSRMQSVRDFLLGEMEARSGNVTVLNVASGACREYTLNFVPTNSRRIDVTCLDNDVLALDFVQTNVRPQLAPHIHLSFVRYNALRMVSTEQNVKRFGRPDILYSVGLCDYIPDKHLIPMLRAWRESVHDDGLVYVAFKDSRRYTTPEYQWLVDWYFYQRTEEECHQLFLDAGYPEPTLNMTRDATGVILNYVGRVPAGSIVRVDEAQKLPRAPQQTPDSAAKPAAE
jgi:hypothetical protein